MGGVVSAGIDNDDLVDKLKEANYIKTETVEKIFRLVDRGYYMTKDSQNIAYRDNAWRSGNLHISAPCIYAQVMEGLQLGAGMSFLNIGSGTGYLSTMAGLLIGPNGINHGVELHGDVVEYARERLNWFLLNSGSIDVCFFCEPQFVQGNALCLKEDTFLYDRVYCGASCPSSHENYMKNLIKVNGVLVMPRNDKLLKIIRTGKSTWTSESLLPVSFSSLVMPDHTLSPESVELPSINIVSLQELTREAVRAIFRARIEEENEELKKVFVYTIPTNTSPKSRKSMSRLSRTFPNASMSDTENDTDSDDRDSEWDRYGTQQNLHGSMHSAFIELARNFVMSRNANADRDRGGREENDMAEEPNEELGEEEEEEEEENHSILDESNEMFVGNGHDLLIRIIERANRQQTTVPEAAPPETAPPDTAPPDVETSSSPKDNSFDQLREEESDPSPTTSNIENNFAKAECSSKKESNETVEHASNAHTEDEDMEDGEKNNKKASIDVPPTQSNSHTEDEEMTEDANEKQPLHYKKFLEKDVKKREKFDSGIVEDLDRAMSIDSSSSCSFKSRSNSDLSLSESEGARKPQPNDSDSPDCSFRNHNNRKWKSKAKVNKRKKRTIHYEKDSKTDSSVPIEKYSQSMREKIKALPLPLPLQIYVNYDRPL